jgi:hypothetical protein
MADTAAIVHGVPEAQFGVESHAANAADPPSRIVEPPASLLGWWLPECSAALELVAVPRFSAATVGERDVSADLRAAFVHAKDVVRALRISIADATAEDVAGS